MKGTQRLANATDPGRASGGLPSKGRRGESRPRTILFLRGASLRNITGARDVELLPELAESGWRPALVAVGARDEKIDWLAGVSVHTVPLPRVPLLGPLIANLAAAQRAVALRPRYLVVSPSYGVAGFLAALVLRETTVITDVRSVPIPGMGWLHDLLGRWQLRLALHLPRLRGVTAISKGTVEALRTKYGMPTNLPVGIWSSAANPRTFHTGVEPINRAALGLTQQFVFVYHGHVALLRGLGTLLHAFSILRVNHSVGLMIVGSGRDVARVQAMTVQLGLDNVVAFVPTVPPADVPKYIAAADAGVIPLPDLWWWAISSPLKLYEYLAMGLPVVATDIEAHRAVSDAVVLTPPTPDGLAQGMATVIDSHAPARPRKAAGLSWDHQAQALAKFIDSLDSDGRNRRSDPHA